MSYHLQCSSNSLNDDSFRLRLSEQTLSGLATKSYIELAWNYFDNFIALATTFLTLFQLPIRYETGTENFTKIKQTTITLISHHIHEWCRHGRMVKNFVPYHLLSEWCINSLFPSLTEDMVKSSVVTEVKVISHSQYVDFIYTYFGTLYENIMNAPWTNFTTPPSPSGKEIHSASGVISYASTQLASLPSGSTLVVSNQTPIASDPTSSSEICAMSSDKGKNEKQPGSKKKGKDKKK